MALMFRASAFDGKATTENVGAAEQPLKAAAGDEALVQSSSWLALLWNWVAELLK